MKLSAVLFDFNGTVLSDEDEYGAAFKKVLKSLGIDVKTDYPHIGGIGVRENWVVFLDKYKIKTEKNIEQLTSETQRAYLDSFSTIEVKEGFEEFIDKLRSQNTLTALATSNEWRVVEEIIGKLGFEKYFDAITTVEEVTFNKPDPDIFLITADKLGVERENCLVIEDSKAGIDAAHGAGMKAVGMARDNKHAETLKEADLVVNSFFELPPEKIGVL